MPVGMFPRVEPGEVPWGTRGQGLEGYSAHAAARIAGIGESLVRSPAIMASVVTSGRQPKRCPAPVAQALTYVVRYCTISAVRKGQGPWPDKAFL